MASTVTVLLPRGRRCNVKITPNTVLLQVLEQACGKQNLDPKLYTLKHHKTVLDLSTPFRYTNLSNNAKLELVEVEKPRNDGNEVVLAVQCEDGRRVQGTFMPTVTLWEAVTQLGVEEGKEEGLKPVLSYMSQHIIGAGKMKKQTLRDWGLSGGKAVVRLHFRPAEESREAETADEPATRTAGEPATRTADEPATRTESHEDEDPKRAQQQLTLPERPPGHTLPSGDLPEGVTEQPHSLQQPEEEPMDATPGTKEDEQLPYFPSHPISIFPPDVEPGSSAPVQPLPPMEEHPLAVLYPGPLQLAQELFKFPTVLQLPPERDHEQPKSKPQSQPIRTYDEPCEREMVVYRLDDACLATPTEEVPDSFFDVTVQDVQVMHGDLKRQVNLTLDETMTTKSMKQTLQEKKLEQYTKAVVRVHLPDQWVLQGCFRPRESLKALVRFVRENLANSQLNFHLYTTPPKQVLRSGKMTITEAGFLPAAIVHLGTESEERPLLSPECLRCAQSALQAEVVHARERERRTSETQSSASASYVSSPAPKLVKTDKPVSTGATAAGVKQVPKWFKIGNK